MKPLPLILCFATGFAVATVIGLGLVLPASRGAWRANVDSDVHRGIQGAMEHVEQSAAKGDCEKAAAQLKVFNERFAKYREGGPPPADWWQEVIATTRPAH